MAAALPPVAVAGWQTFLQVLNLGLGTNAAGAFISPLSLYIALALCLNGAGPGSDTYRQMWQVLQRPALSRTASQSAILAEEARFNKELQALQSSLSTPAGNGTEFIIANAVWTKGTPVRPTYASSMQDFFMAQVKSVQSAAPINDWAKAATKGLITQVIPPTMPFDLVLTNAIYFKGLWEHPFKKVSTDNRLFTTAAGKPVQVPTMFANFKASTARPVRVATTPTFKGVRMPYKGGSYSAVVVLPMKEKDPRKVDEAVAALDLAVLLDKDTWTTYGYGVDVYMPTFKLKNDITLSKAVVAQGMVDAFNPRADFSRLSTNKLFVSDILQSVFIQVDETGTEAAAVTSLVMLTSAMISPEPLEMRFDRPFLFLLVEDRTNSLLFAGVVKDPSKAHVAASTGAAERGN